MFAPALKWKGRFEVALSVCRVATLSCSDGYSIFDTGSMVVRFRTSQKLKRYINVRHWDDGYLVVDAEACSSDSNSLANFLSILVLTLLISF